MIARMPSAWARAFSEGPGSVAVRMVKESPSTSSRRARRPSAAIHGCGQCVPTRRPLRKRRRTRGPVVRGGLRSRPAAVVSRGMRQAAADRGGTVLAAGHGPAHGDREADHMPGVRLALTLVGLQNSLLSALLEDAGELPGEVVGVPQPGTQSLADERRGEVGGVAEEEDPSAAPAVGEARPEGVHGRATTRPRRCDRNPDFTGAPSDIPNNITSRQRSSHFLHVNVQVAWVSCRHERSESVTGLPLAACREPRRPRTTRPGPGRVERPR